MSLSWIFSFSENVMYRQIVHHAVNIRKMYTSLTSPCTRTKINKILHFVNVYLIMFPHVAALKYTSNGRSCKQNQSTQSNRHWMKKEWYICKNWCVSWALRWAMAFWLPTHAESKLNGDNLQHHARHYCM